MKRLLALLLVCLAYPVFGQGPVSPCYWSGSVTKCFPSTGLQLSSGQALQLGDYVGDLVSVRAASPTATYALVLPAGQGGAGAVPQNDGSGNLSWAPGASYPIPTASLSGSFVSTITASTGGIIAASPTTGAAVLSSSGTSGGVPYFNNATSATSSGVLAKGAPVLGGGAGGAPTTLATAGGVLVWNWTTQTPGFSAVPLASSAAVSGVLPAANMTSSTAAGGAGTYTPGAQPGYSAGSAISAGNVGQVILNSPATAVAPNSTGGWAQVSSGAAVSGVFLITGSCALTVGNISAPTNLGCGISTSSSGNPDTFAANNIAINNPVGNTSSEIWTSCGPRYVNISSSATYYLMCRVDYTTVGTAKWAVESTLQIVRVH